ncbi:conserved hypothetical protein [Vibrio nigripulchritudo SOn1]|uniref:Aldehyde dehydrogenase domain-containing protein n=1 Tax=Vibrio nigripulchritudo SOn1 TaxID=1238450 RepID=A0AAV2VSC9_9VIBR|nr:aldehyde dehydrogenase family protein [Vibrio nigripulchritudo]CCO47566.1 conserved hypothetical protein [Vibrio nigripulchritudo SOn1]
MDTVSLNEDDGALHQVHSCGFGKGYEARKRSKILDFSSTPIAEISLAPPIYVHELSSQAKSRKRLKLAEIQAAICEASDVFLNGTVCGLSPSQYMNLVHRATGLPESTVQHSIHYIGDALEHISDTVQFSLPRGLCTDLIGKDAFEGTGIVSRRGDVLSVVAAGNGPGLHALWPQAVALGYRVIIKPSNSEPFTAQRLVESLSQVGLVDYVSLCCTDHKGVSTLLETTDLGIVYGGKKTVEQYAHQPNILVQGPGHSKVVVTSEVNQQSAIKHTAECVMTLGGAACVSTSVVYVDGDVEEFATKLADYFKRSEYEKHYPKASDSQIEAFKQTLNLSSSSGSFGFHTTHTDDGIIVKPYVDYSLGDSESLRHRELPFPCVSVLPLDRDNLPSQLKGSLAVSLYSTDVSVVEDVLQLSDIGNVYVGPIPTTWMSKHVPHDGYLAEFLTKARGYRIHKEWCIGEDFKSL